MSNTQFVKACVTEIYDLSTQAGEQTVFRVYTPSMAMAGRHLVGHMLQFRKMRYAGCKIALVPASTLPADPLQVSYEAGEPTIDPRDMMNPILWRYYHGDIDAFDGSSFNAVVNEGDAPLAINSGGLFESDYADSGAGVIDNTYFQYYLALMDDHWQKAGVQQGFTAFAKALVYDMASNFQIGALNDGGGR